MAQSQAKLVKTVHNLNRLTAKAPYRDMLRDMAPYLTARGVSRMLGLHYSVIRRIRDPKRYLYCRTRNAALIQELYTGFVALFKDMEKKRKLYEKFSGF